MSQVDTDEMNRSETEEGPGGIDNLRLVPVAESIRYRKRAQSAEKKVEALAEQLAEARAEVAKMSEQLSSLETDKKLMHKLAVAGAVDLESAVLIAKARMQGQDKADLDACIEQLKREKQYLFADTGGALMARKTAGAKQRMTTHQAILERAAKKAATTGNRTDLQEYLRVRRNFL